MPMFLQKECYSIHYRPPFHFWVSQPLTQNTIILSGFSFIVSGLPRVYHSLQATVKHLYILSWYRWNGKMDLSVIITLQMYQQTRTVSDWFETAKEERYTQKFNSMRIGQINAIPYIHAFLLCLLEQCHFGHIFHMGLSFLKTMFGRFGWEKKNCKWYHMLSAKIFQPVWFFSPFLGQ